MKILMLIEHDNNVLKSSNFHTLSASQQLGGEIEALLIGYRCDSVLEKAKKLFAKKKVISEDNFDEDEPLDSIGIRQFWLAKRAAIKMIGILRAAQAKAKEKAKNEAMFGFEGEGEEL